MIILQRKKVIYISYIGIENLWYFLFLELMFFSCPIQNITGKIRFKQNNSIKLNEIN